MMKLYSVVLGILCLSVGLFFIILYLNLLTMEYSFFQYVHFISKRVECLLFIVGLLLILLPMKGKIKHELLLRYQSKFQR